MWNRIKLNYQVIILILIEWFLRSYFKRIICWFENWFYILETYWNLSFFERITKQLKSFKISIFKIENIDEIMLVIELNLNKLIDNKNDKFMSQKLIISLIQQI
jgi:hypothetical protein